MTCALIPQSKSCIPYPFYGHDRGHMHWIQRQSDVQLESKMRCFLESILSPVLIVSKVLNNVQCWSVWTLEEIWKLLTSATGFLESWRTMRKMVTCTIKKSVRYFFVIMRIATMVALNLPNHFHSLFPLWLCLAVFIFVSLCNGVKYICCSVYFSTQSLNMETKCTRRRNHTPQRKVCISCHEPPCWPAQ